MHYTIYHFPNMQDFSSSPTPTSSIQKSKSINWKKLLLISFYVGIPIAVVISIALSVIAYQAAMQINNPTALVPFSSNSATPPQGTTAPSSTPSSSVFGTVSSINGNTITVASAANPANLTVKAGTVYKITATTSTQVIYEKPQKIATGTTYLAQLANFTDIKPKYWISVIYQPTGTTTTTGDAQSIKFTETAPAHR